ncbi:hypothetical protein CHS0354_032148 [Potamilus streckersoni]|uniref:Uncharacterized protein n=1 Tax=Potamilus streckersoni TaxID=2493646 RepID=A0AAE0WCB1_9BIVA|nr:hypothetical protein CHS0354_032148 [Potamilus streckersoni]
MPDTKSIQFLSIWDRSIRDMGTVRIEYKCVGVDSVNREEILVSGPCVYCFGLAHGKQYFVYSSNDLKYPRGVAVDKEDNIYVVGNGSNNIHKLSPDGVTLQIIAFKVPRKQREISFGHNRENFVTTNLGAKHSQLNYFVHK